MKPFFLFCFVFFFGLTSCNFSLVTGELVSPEGSIIRESRSVDKFSGISANGGIHVILTQSEHESLDIEAYENLLPYIETSIKGNTLVIKRKNGVYFKSSPKITAYVSVASPDELSAAGGSSFVMDNVITSDRLVMKGAGGSSFQGTVDCSDLMIGISGGGNLHVRFSCNTLTAETSGGGRLDLSGSSDRARLRMSGGGRAVADIDCRTIVTKTSGGGHISLSGSADDYELSSSGGGNVKAYDFTVKNLSANMSGGGYAEITVTETLSMVAAGGGRLNYKGDAVAQRVSLSGGGKLNKVQ
jgi:hypothetical protein